MELVINANILFSLAKSSSKTRDLISNFALSLYAPNFAKTEIIKYKEDILKKANLNDFNIFLNILNTRINFVDLEDYKEQIKKCKGIIKDEKDIEYVALAMKLNIPLWTNDRLLKDQNLIKALTTSDIIEILTN